jgi:Zn-dependent membrane protease YugP
MGFSPTLVIIFVATALISWLVSHTLKRRFREYSQIPTRYTGAEIAQIMLRENGINDVRVICTPGKLTDHYDPTNRTVNLSESVYAMNSVAAAAVAAHECGHAIQHQKLYGPLQWRMAAVGITTMAGNASPFVGMGLAYFAPKIAFPILALCFGIVMVFQLITLPVEFDATARAKHILAHTGAVAPGAETAAMSKVLDAAALTYVAAFISALGTFLYFAMHLLGGQRDE